MKAESKSILLVTLLGVVSFFLKLGGIIGVSWWVALLPFWLPLAVLVALIAGFIVVMVGGCAYFGFWGLIGRGIGLFFRKGE